MDQPDYTFFKLISKTIPDSLNKQLCNIHDENPDYKMIRVKLFRIPFIKIYKGRSDNYQNKLIFSSKTMSFKLDNYDLSKQVVILTGATDGIGKEMARILSGFNPKRLILPARNLEKGKDVLGYIKSSNGHANNVEIWEMDLADLKSVKTFADKFINEVGELHILINNAGIMTNSQIFKTKDNLELQFQVNHLAPLLLTRLLLDTIKKSVSTELPGKIVFVSSRGHRYGLIDFDNLNLEKGAYWYFVQAYGNTKLMNVIVSNELSRILQNENISTYSMHPGVISTNLSHMNTGLGGFLVTSIIKFFSYIKLFAITPEQGAINVLYPALSTNESGKYYSECVEEEPIEPANDQKIAKKLWEVSEKILKDHGFDL